MKPRVSVIKHFETIVVGLQSDVTDAFLRDLISTVITLVINGILKPRVSSILSEDQRP